MHLQDLAVVRDRLDAVARLLASVYDLLGQLVVRHQGHEIRRREILTQLRGVESWTADCTARLETLYRPLPAETCPHCAHVQLIPSTTSRGECPRCRGLLEVPREGAGEPRPGLAHASRRERDRPAATGTERP